MARITLPWEVVREKFGRGPFPCMADLAQKIEASRYAAGLFAWTSMHDLCIVQTEMDYPPYPATFLRVRPADAECDFIEFRYMDTGVPEKQWHRVVEAEQAFWQLEQFLQQLHWFNKAS